MPNSLTSFDNTSWKNTAFRNVQIQSYGFHQPRCIRSLFACKRATGKKQLKNCNCIWSVFDCEAWPIQVPLKRYFNLHLVAFRWVWVICWILCTWVYEIGNNNILTLQLVALRLHHFGCCIHICRNCFNNSIYVCCTFRSSSSKCQMSFISVKNATNLTVFDVERLKTNDVKRRRYDNSCCMDLRRINNP